MSRVRSEATSVSRESSDWRWLSTDTVLFLKALCTLIVEEKDYA